jgi:tetratricopeptide (TPR) repeat protein
MADTSSDHTITHTSAPDGSASNPPSGSETVVQSPDDVAQAAARSAEQAPATTVSIPGYIIERELGRGGMGVVYLARHLALNRTVALKMILSGDHSATRDRIRFLAEAEAIARLQHPNIVQLYEIGTHGDCPFFTLEYCEGGTLDTKLGGQPMAAPEAAALVETLTRAIQIAHEAGIVHRDLKPQNVLLGPNGAPKVTDFGLAKRVDGGSDLTASGAVLGTPSYMAPEQAAGKGKQVGQAADIYALGAILYAALSGRPPFRAATPVDTVLQVLHDDPVPPTQLVPGIPRDLETICLKCLRKDPARRYATATALADDLRRWQDGEPITARPVGSVERVWKWSRRHPTTAVLLAVGLFIAIGLFVGSIWFTGRLRYERNLAQAAERSEQRRTHELAAALEIVRQERDEKEKARKSETSLKEDAIENDKDLRIVILSLVRFMQENAARSGGNTLDVPSLLAVATRHTAPVPGQNLRVRIGMLQMVGILYTAFGRANDAIPYVEEMVQLCRTVFGDDHRETLNAMNAQAQVYIFAGQPLKGLLTLNYTLRRQEEQFGPTDPATIDTKRSLARVYLMAGQQRKALEICETTLTDLRRMFGRDTVEALEFLDFAATACAELQLPEQEEAHLREFVRISGLMFGQSGEPTATALARLGKQLLRRQKWEAAEPTLRQCLRIREELDRNPSIPLPRWVVPNTRCLLGEALLGQKKYAEAEPLLVGGAEQLLAEHGSVPPKEREIIQHAIDHVVQLYTATGNRAKADEWRNRTVPVLPAVVPIPLASD